MEIEEYVYKLTDPFTQEVRYIGLTTEPIGRLTSHIYQTSGQTQKDQWVIGLRERGAFPVMEVIEKITSGNGKEREKYWIKLYLEQGANLFNRVHNRNHLTVIGYNPLQQKYRKHLAWFKHLFLNLPAGLSPHDKVVLFALIILCNGEETPCLIVMKELVETADISYKGLQEALSRLSKREIITLVGKQRAVTITVHMSKLEDGREE